MTAFIVWVARGSRIPSVAERRSNGTATIYASSNVGGPSASRAHLGTAAAAAAILRLEAVELNPEAAFSPLGESLTWICAQDELLEREVPTYRGHRNSDSTGESLLGLRFARNHMIHGGECFHCGSA